MGSTSAADIADLDSRTTGSVWAQPAAGEDSSGYDDARGGFNLTLDTQPALILAAETPDDVAAGIRFAAEHRLPVALQSTGHGIHLDMHDGLLISTRRMTAVQVDPDARIARVEAGATSGDVIAAGAPYGLSACIGGAPAVGYVSFCLGGGLGPLGRAHGWAADHVRRFDVVTADGRELSVSAEEHPDLFWALRGGGGNLAAVTAIHIDLLPLPEIYGGGIWFAGEQSPEILDRFASVTATAPDELSLSIAVVHYPDLPVLPSPLRGTFVCHLRVTYLGDADAGRALIAPFYELEPLLDSVRIMASTELGSIHGDPVDPMPTNNDSLALTSDDIDWLKPFVQAPGPFMLEIRHLQGKLAIQPSIPDAVGYRAARMNLFTSAYPFVDRAVGTAAQQQVFDAAAPLSIGGAIRNFLPDGGDPTTCYEPATVDRLAELKDQWDPANVFRFVPPVRRIS